MGEERHRYSWLTYQQCCAWLVFGNRMSEGQVSSSIDIFLGLFGWHWVLFFYLFKFLTRICFGVIPLLFIEEIMELVTFGHVLLPPIAS